MTLHGQNRAAPTVLIFGMIAVLTLWGCGKRRPDSSPPAEPEAEVRPDKLRKLYAKLAGEPAVMEELVQLAMPTSDSIRLWYRAPANFNPKVEVRDSTGSVLPEAAVRKESYDAEWGTGVLAISGLTAGSDYELTISMSDSIRTLKTHTQPSDDGATPDHFSVLAFSCNEPFHNEREGVLARDVVAWENFKRRGNGELFDSSGKLPPRASFAIGLGDQVYVDPDASSGKDDKLAFFDGNRSGKTPKQRRIDMNDSARYLQVVYDANFGYFAVDDALQAVPTMMTWDDHEIRDGWGSQGDEDSEIWQQYFKSARSAFTSFQFRRNQTKVPEQGEHFGFSKKWGRDVGMFILDARSDRRCEEKTLLSESQWNALTTWLQTYENVPNATLILGSAVPVFTVSPKAFQLPFGELRDDILDKWGSECNRDSLQRLTSILDGHFSANPTQRLLILSGDVHHSALAYLTRKNDGGDEVVFGHEVTTSGIAHSIDSHFKQWAVNTATHFPGRAGDNVKVGAFPRGGIERSPNFAEIIFKRKSPDSPHELSVVFYPSADSGKKTPHLANVFPLGPQEITLGDYEFVHTSADLSSARKSGAWTTAVRLNRDSVPAVNCRGKKTLNVVHARSLHCTVDLARDSVEPVSGLGSSAGANDIYVKDKKLPTGLREACRVLTEDEIPKVGKPKSCR